MAMESKKKIKEEVSRGEYVESLKLKKVGLKRIFKSFIFSIDGLKYAFTHEQSMILQLFVLIGVILCAVCFKITPIQWVITLVMGALIFVAELFNTSIEAVVDMVTGKYHPLAKIAKDTASAACFIVNIIAAGMWLTVFLPKIILLFR